MTLVYIGDGRNNVAHSLLVTGAILGVNVTIVSPFDLQPKKDIQQLAKKLALQSQGKLSIQCDLDAVEKADIIYTDVWVSMEEESQTSERIKQLLTYQVNKKLTEKIINKDFIFMHCLPSFHDLNTEIMKEIKWEYNLD